MLNLKNISYFLRYPLMAVMLLWALTLPGQEVEVYRFLVKGPAANIAQNATSAASDNVGKTTVAQQAVQVFLDAKTSSTVVIHLQQAAQNPLLLLAAFAFPVAQVLPVCPVTTTGSTLLQQILAVAVLPNAP